MHTKETIVFVHGAWHGKWCWDKYFRKSFEQNGYDVITFDLPGHDKKGKRKGINKYTLSDYVSALKNEIAKLESPPIIIGHSMGGLILQKYLEQETCKKAIFLASVPPNGVIKTTLKYFLPKWYTYPSLLTMNLYGLVNTTSKTRKAFFSENLPQNLLKEFTSQLTSESFRAFLDMLVPKVKVNENSKIPTLVVAAEHDTLFSINDNQKTAQKFNSELIIMKDVAHDMMLEMNHKKVAHQLINWLKK